MQLKKTIILILAFISFKLIAQPVQKAATDAFLITRMAEKFHVQPRTLDDAFSADLYTSVLKKIDAEKLYFTQEDIKLLDAFKFQLDNEIAGKKTAFLQLLITFYTQRLQQLDTMADNILKTPFNFSLNEKYTVQEDTSYPANTAAQRVKLYKNFKYPIVSGIAMLVKETKDATKQKKLIDSTQAIFRKKILESFKRNIQKEIQSPGGIAQLLSNDYCRAIATCYDPHSAYMTLTDRENFESGLGKKIWFLGLI